jgi:hypothetical protein
MTVQVSWTAAGIEVGADLNAMACEEGDNDP